jgi:hypothetical protein
MEADFEWNNSALPAAMTAVARIIMSDVRMDDPDSRFVVLKSIYGAVQQNSIVQNK